MLGSCFYYENWYTSRRNVNIKSCFTSTTKMLNVKTVSFIEASCPTATVHVVVVSVTVNHTMSPADSESWTCSFSSFLMQLLGCVQQPPPSHRRSQVQKQCGANLPSIHKESRQIEHFLSCLQMWPSHLTCTATRGRFLLNCQHLMEKIDPQ